MVWWGVAAWPPRPTILIRIRSTEAQTGPARSPTAPAGREFQRWKAKMASTAGSSRTPSSIIAGAPAAISSAGWKMNLTLPARVSRRRVSISAAAKTAAVWPSCPQACITPGLTDR